MVLKANIGPPVFICALDIYIPRHKGVWSWATCISPCYKCPVSAWKGVLSWDLTLARDMANVSSNPKNQVPYERLRWYDIATSFVSCHTVGGILPEVYTVSVYPVWFLLKNIHLGGKTFYVCVCEIALSCDYWFHFSKVWLIIWFGLEGMK